MAEEKTGATESAEVEVAKEALVLLIAIIAIVAVISIWGVYGVSHNLLSSIYYTLTSLIDINSEGFAYSLMTSLPQFGGAFYTLVAIELLDGVVKVLLIGFIVAIFVNALAKVDISSRINGIKRSRLGRHIILCGYSELGEQVAEKLGEKGKSFVVVDKSLTKLEELGERGYTALEGDFTEMEVLRRAGAEKASAIIFCSDTDITNLMGVLAARKINKDVTIISRAREDFSVSKMQRAGADLCIIPELVAGLELGNKLTLI